MLHMTLILHYTHPLQQVWEAFVQTRAGQKMQAPRWIHLQQLLTTHTTSWFSKGRASSLPIRLYSLLQRRKTWFQSLLAQKKLSMRSFQVPWSRWAASQVVRKLERTVGWWTKLSFSTRHFHCLKWQEANRSYQACWFLKLYAPRNTVLHWRMNILFTDLNVEAVFSLSRKQQSYLVTLLCRIFWGSSIQRTNLMLGGKEINGKPLWNFNHWFYLKAELEVLTSIICPDVAHKWKCKIIQNFLLHEYPNWLVRSQYKCTLTPVLGS